LKPAGTNNACPGWPFRLPSPKATVIFGAALLAKAPSEKTPDELAEDMHTRPEGLTHLMAKAEMELRRTSAQRRPTTYMFLASIAAAVSAAAAAITAGIAAYVAFHGG
jgi:hypothetical protein